MDLSEFEDKLELLEKSKEYLSETAKWAKFLAILGIIFCVLFVIVGFIMAFTYDSLLKRSNPTNNLFPQIGLYMSFIYFGIAGAYFVPCIYLLKFSLKTSKAIKESDSLKLQEAFRNHKSMYKFMGIFALVSIGIYIFLLAGIVYQDVSKFL